MHVHGQASHKRSKKMMWGYTTRQERARWVAEKYAVFLGDSVLDVGCWMGHLRTYLRDDVRYVGVDIDGAPDLRMDLDKGILPFQDNVFETVVCTEVLEHLDRPHAVFDEMLRVASKWLIISLPNTFAVLKWRLLTGSSPPLKFLGLPVESPRDRHKWFFNYTQAVQFVEGRARFNSAEVQEVEPWLDSARSVKGWVKRLLAPGAERRRNLFTFALWAVVRKNGQM